MRKTLFESILGAARCDDCHAEKLVAFSCKKRGFHPSCGARRMAETAALLATTPAASLRSASTGVACG